MKIIFLKIAGFIIKIAFYPSQYTNFQKSFIKEITNEFKNFIIQKEEKYDYEIRVFEMEHRIKRVKDNLNEEYITLFSKNIPYNIIDTYYYLSLSSFIHILSMIIAILISQKKGFILHASATKINERAVLFLGRSEAGKSTSARLLKSKYNILEDDRVFIKKSNGKYLFFHSVFINKNSRYKRDDSGYPLDRLFFIKKADFFRVKRISDKSTIINLLSDQLIKPNEGNNTTVKNLLQFVDNFNEFYFMHFKKDSKGMIKFFKELYG